MAVTMTERRLDEFDKDEWREVARLIKPAWTEAQFEEAWQEFMELQQRKKMQ